MARYKVRLGTYDDAVDIMTLLRTLNDEVEIDFPAFQDGPGLRKIGECLTVGFVAVAVDQEGWGEVVGSIGLIPNKNWWNVTDYMLQSMWFYVLPDHRKSHIAEALLKTAKQISDKHGIPLVNGIVFGEGAETKDRFLAINGFEYVGGTFVYGFGRKAKNDE